MSRGFAIYLGCTGALALLAIAVPGLVLIGYFAGILPGLILGSAPTLFLYSIPWWVLRELLLRGSSAVVKPQSDAGNKTVRWTAGVAAALILIAPAIMVPRALNAPIERAAAELRADDRDTARPLALPPVIGIVTRGTYEWVGETPKCTTLCQRLLYNGAVSRIIAGDTIPPTIVRAFWIERRTEPCPKPPIDSHDVFFPDDYKSKKNNPVVVVRERTAAGECIIQGPGKFDEASLLISYLQIKKGVSPFDAPWALALDTVSATRLEITQADGQILYRRTEVKTEPLSVPLAVGLSAGLLTTVTYAGWGRSETTYSEIGPQGSHALPAVLGAAARLPD
jgi:hypothetical protein